MCEHEFKAGRKLDTLVAEQIMGWKTAVWEHPYGSIGGYDVYKGDKYYVDPEGNAHKYPLYFSENIACAWKVVEMMNSLISKTSPRRAGCVSFLTLVDTGGDFVAFFSDLVGPEKTIQNFMYIDSEFYETDKYRDYAPCARAETAELAICLAALEAVKVLNDNN